MSNIQNTVQVAINSPVVFHFAMDHKCTVEITVCHECNKINDYLSNTI